ncbi:50S ribosomal protein L29 [Candidatus Kaiserbacteria bacterium]|nr:50S ribosomal protein L29 [Candidatus Kaiserbacteria bacterium]
MTVEDLHKALGDKREGLRAFRFGAAGSRSRNVREGRTLRREIAQIMTELRARELAAKK